MFHYHKLQNSFLDYTFVPKEIMLDGFNHLSLYHYRSMFTTYVFGMIHQDIQGYILSSKFRLLGHSRSDSDNGHMSHCIQSQMFRSYNLTVKKLKSYRIYVIYIVRHISVVLHDHSGEDWYISCCQFQCSLVYINHVYVLIYACYTHTSLRCLCSSQTIMYYTMQL